MLPEALSAFDTSEGFTVTNNTAQNVYLQTSASAFETIEPQKTSTVHTTYRSYPVRVNSNTGAAIYLTVVVDPSDGSVRVNPGPQRGKFTVTSNFA